MDFYVRKATAKEKSAVLNIHGNVYDGLDYLPEYYDYFLNSQHVTPYVYTDGENICAFVAGCLADDGETLVTRAARVSPEMQGKHVYKRFISEVESMYEKRGKTKFHAMTKSEPPSESFLLSYKPVAAKEIHLFEFRASFVTDKLNSLIEENSPKGKVIYNIPEAYLSNPYRNYLFPEGRIVVDWFPFHPVLANIPLYKGRNTVFFSDISMLESSTQHGTEQEVQGLLSASTIFKSHGDIDATCNLDIFGTDFRSINEHVIFHMKQIQIAKGENIHQFKNFHNKT